MARSIGKHSIRPRHKLARILAVGTSGVLIAAFGPAVVSQAAPTYNTVTTVTASPASATAGTSVKLSATVKVPGVVAILIPAGSVTFTTTNGSSTYTVGTRKLACGVFPCTVNLTSTTIPVGTTSVTATYSGQPPVNGSSGSTALTISPASPPPSSTSSTVTCYSNQPCDSGTVTSSNNSTQVEVSSDGSSGTQTLSVSTSSGTLHGCKAAAEHDGDGDDDDGVFVGALATFSSTATDVAKTITYTGTGSTGATMNHQYGEHTDYAGCYGSPAPFKGYTNGSYGNAVYNATDKLYEAMLSNCANNDGALPCMTNIANEDGSDSYVIQAPAGDPKGIG